MQTYFKEKNETISTNSSFVLGDVVTYLEQKVVNPSTQYRFENYTNIAEAYNVFCEDDSGVSIFSNYTKI